MNPVLIATITLAALIFVVALLYSTVGHAGASGYLAAMAVASHMHQFREVFQDNSEPGKGAWAVGCC